MAGFYLDDPVVFALFRKLGIADLFQCNLMECDFHKRKSAGMPDTDSRLAVRQCTELNLTLHFLSPKFRRIICMSVAVFILCGCNNCIDAEWQLSV